MRRLDLSDNRFESLPLAAAFGRLPELRVLILRGNRLAHLYGPTIEAIAALPALAELDLSHNRLATLPARFVQRLPAGVRRLNLRANAFGHVPAELQWAPRLQALNLGGNPLRDLEYNK